MMTAKPLRPRANSSPSTPGTTSTCGIRADASVACWGDGYDGQATPPEGEFVSASADSTTPARSGPTAPSPAGATLTVAQLLRLRREDLRRGTSSPSAVGNTPLLRSEDRRFRRVLGL